MATLLPGCKKWLDVTSKSQVVETAMFADENGFADAMAGIYYTMASGTLYGDKLSMSLMDVLARRYNVSDWPIGHSTYSSAAGYGFGGDPPDYSLYYTTDEIKPMVSGIWERMYFAIANTNNILKNIDGRKGVFSGNNYSLMKGEALGLRAFMHFDLLRMFGYPYVSGADSANIPYVTLFSAKLITPLYSTRAVLDSCIADLNAAAILLAEDDIKGSSPVSDWLNNRKCHFNKLAVEATLARIYLYKGDKANALIHATNVINANKLRFNTEADFNPSGQRVDKSYSAEQVFALNKPELATTSQIADYFQTNYNSQSLSNNCGKVDGSTQNIENIYEVPNGGGSDLRYRNSWEVVGEYVYINKYSQTAVLERGLVPLIRLPEMYYIAAECSGTGPAGLGYLNMVRKSRGISELPDGMDAETFQFEIFKEYQKEFYGEGQLFYYYKRLDMPYLLECDNFTQLPMTTVKYVFPLSDEEKKIGGR